MLHWSAGLLATVPCCMWVQGRHPCQWELRKHRRKERVCTHSSCNNLLTRKLKEALIVQQPALVSHNARLGNPGQDQAPSVWQLPSSRFHFVRPCSHQPNAWATLRLELWPKQTAGHKGCVCKGCAGCTRLYRQSWCSKFLVCRFWTVGRWSTVDANSDALWLNQLNYTARPRHSSCFQLLFQSQLSHEWWAHYVPRENICTATKASKV